MNLKAIITGVAFGVAGAVIAKKTGLAGAPKRKKTAKKKTTTKRRKK